MEQREHAHCVSCFQGFGCRQQASCRVISCSNGCGVFTHSCKMDDHRKEVCPQARVACPNQLYGCAKVTTRRNLSAHLLVCPAYVISCPYGFKLPAQENASFKCPEVIRRDTFASHMRDHSDLHECFDGWLEGRCPLSFLGCSFTFSRWKPQAPGQHVRYSEELASFVTALDPAEGAQGDAQTNNSHCHLLRLPPELLLRIGAFLDGVSLNSLAVTCKRLRHVCALLLNSKGFVSRSWVPQEDGRWAMDTCHRWRLNRNMEPIRRWTIADNALSALERHLKECPFNEREEKSPEPALVMMVKAK